VTTTREVNVDVLSAFLGFNAQLSDTIPATAHGNRGRDIVSKSRTTLAVNRSRKHPKWCCEQETYPSSPVLVGGGCASLCFRSASNARYRLLYAPGAVATMTAARELID
jgi:hypothetical protein